MTGTVIPIQPSKPDLRQRAVWRPHPLEDAVDLLFRGVFSPRQSRAYSRNFSASVRRVRLMARKG